MKVNLTPRAQIDLERIGDFIAADSPDRAKSFIEELLDRCASLANFPNRFPLLNRYSSRGIRKCVHGSYLIFYRVEPTIVHVLHVLHCATDYGPLLDGD